MTAGVRRYDMGKCIEGEHTPAPAQIRAQRGEEITDTASMRAFQLKQMVKAAKGEIDTDNGKNVCSLAQQVFQASKLEIEAAKIMKAGGHAPEPLALTDANRNG